MTSSEVWDATTAETYDADCRGMFAPDVLDPAVDLLAELAGSGRALELAVGTGRVAVPLAERGVPVSGIELSEPMAERLRAKTSAVPVTIGDMATTRVPGEFTLVYLVFNTISNLRTQDEQVACFENAAAHLSTGGRFVIELGEPPLRRLPPGQLAAPFDASADHLGFDTFDLAAQELVSHHYTRDGDTIRYGAGRFRYAWPAELDLMARIAGLRLESRWADWRRAPYTSESEAHVSVWQRPLT